MSMSAIFPKTPDAAFAEAHEVFLRACHVADRLAEPALTDEMRAQLRVKHGALMEEHLALCELWQKLRQPGVAVH